MLVKHRMTPKPFTVTTDTSVKEALELLDQHPFRHLPVVDPDGNLQGVVTNRYKTVNEGKVIASGAIGSQEFYQSLHNNVVIEFRPSDYVNNPAIISQNNKMVAINFARTMDLSGQVYADALPQNHFSGVTGMFDFILGASMSAGGRSIIVIPATSIDGKTPALGNSNMAGSVPVTIASDEI